MSIKAETSFSLKDQLFNAGTVSVLSKALVDADPNFTAAKFQKAALKRFPELELKARIQWLVSCLEEFLPKDFASALEILHAALPVPLDPSLSDDDFGKFIWIVPGEYVAKHGCRTEYLDDSLDFLREATKRFSSENAIRPFLKTFPEQTMRFVHVCSEDENYHVRRLASEGIRPFLPWAPRVDLRIGDIVPVLDRLHVDKTRFVTRSVANTLNDIAKIDGALVVATLAGWHKQSKQDDKELEWMTRHALRTLLKADDPLALSLVGYPTTPKFSVSSIQASSQVSIGEHLSWRCQITSKATQKLRIALRVYFLKANGSHSVKVFAVKDLHAQAGEKIPIDKRLLFKPMTTRVLYAGEHHVELVVNGIKRGKRPFALLQP